MYRNKGVMKMLVQVEIPDTLVLGRNGSIGQLEVDWAKVPTHVINHIAAVYFPQYITDAANAKTDSTPAERFAVAEKKLQQMYAGELRARREGSDPVDPVMKEAYDLAKPFIIKGFVKNGVWPKKGTDKFQTAVNARMKMLKQDAMPEEQYIEKWLAANPAIMKLAEKNVAERDKVSGNVVEVAGL